MLVLAALIYILGIIGSARIIVSVTLGDTRPVVLALIWPLIFPLAGVGMLGAALARAIGFRRG